MTALAAPIPIRRRRPTERIAVRRDSLVHELMDAEARAFEAIRANGFCIEQVRRLPPGPWRDSLLQATVAAHDSMKALLVELRASAHRYETTPAIND